MSDQFNRFDRRQSVAGQVARLTRENARMRNALKLYANPENWRFYHTKEGYIRWVTELGPDTAMDALTPEVSGTLTIKKTNNG